MQYILIIFFSSSPIPPKPSPTSLLTQFHFFPFSQNENQNNNNRRQDKNIPKQKKKKHGVLGKGLSQDWLIDPVTLYWREQIFPAPAGITCKYHLCRHFALFEHRQVF